MKANLITICVLQLYLQALNSLPAPVNLSIHSVNFEHLLRWEPGPGTPLDATYRISFNSNKGYLPPTSNTEMNLTDYLEDVYLQYEIMVQALHNGMVSPWSSKTFTPWTDTVLGPPELSVVGCGNCLQLAIKFPRRKEKSLTEKIYNALEFTIFLNKSEQQTILDRTSQWNYTLGDLQPGAEYCVQVHPSLGYKQYSPSGWTCAFTSPVAQSRVPGLLVLFVIVLFLGGLVILGLIYTGHLCNPKTRHPRVLTSLPKAYFMEDSIVLFPDPVRFEIGRSRKSITEELQPFKASYQEKMEQRNHYEERAMRHSSISSSSKVSHSADFKTSITTIAPQYSGTSSTTASEIQEAPLLSVLLLEGELVNENEGCMENDVEEELEQGCTDVNLLSVTLGALEDLGTEDSEQTESILNERHLVIIPDLHQPFVPIGLPESLLGQSPKALQRNTSVAQGHCGHVLTDCSLRTFAKGYIGSTQEKEEGEGTNEDDDGQCSGYMQR
uniref:Interleukin-10 receptor subunit beta-like n=1 Tax=Paramormyrops kingsleyae TaxID=1676925 RepID=A0A3B3SNK0_9TELE|nr:interleukin-10 receptor subunit beta-like isoform X1 [Paramormyrops kingsleyae]